MEEERQLISLEDLESDFFLLEEDKNTPGFSWSVSVAFLLIDCSGSMVGENKLEKAKAGAIDFAHNAVNKGYSVGVIAFGSQAKLVSPAVSNANDLEGSVKSIEVDGSTNMSAGLELAKKQLEMVDSSDAQRAIVLVTDGAPDSVDQALNVAEKCKQSGISIITLGTDDADRDFLKKIASSESLAEMVSSNNLQGAIASAGNLLPQGK